MVGPGTGVAPFRAFLQERQATGAPGKNWLFFGHQRQATDFLYRDELHEMKAGRRADPPLARLVARRRGKILRPGPHARGRARSCGTWLAQGAHFYVCGDAKRMAKDVEAALVEIVATHGVRSTDEAIAFVGSLKKAGRYQADVY